MISLCSGIGFSGNRMSDDWSRDGAKIPTRFRKYRSQERPGRCRIPYISIVIHRVLCELGKAHTPHRFPVSYFIVSEVVSTISYDKIR
jgi:hypothetical protein